MTNRKRLIQELNTSIKQVKAVDASELVGKRWENIEDADELDKIAEFVRLVVDLFVFFTDEIFMKLPDNQLEEVKKVADEALCKFESIRDTELMLTSDDMHEFYQSIFSQLHTLTVYSRVNSDLSTNSKKLSDLSKKVDSLENEFRQSSAEEVADKHGDYFFEAAKKFDCVCLLWMIATIFVAILVGSYGVLMIFLHKFDFFHPNDLYETIQITTGKLIVFFILTYMLFLCARNFLANRHNAIVSHHRHNALSTYRAMVNAVHTDTARDVVLLHTASAIYDLHETGYARPSNAENTSKKSLAELISRTFDSIKVNNNG